MMTAPKSQHPSSPLSGQLKRFVTLNLLTSKVGGVSDLMLPFRKSSLTKTPTLRPCRNSTVSDVASGVSDGLLTVGATIAGFKRRLSAQETRSNLEEIKSLKGSNYYPKSQC